jgi:hypothetical protein
MRFHITGLVQVKLEVSSLEAQLCGADAASGADFLFCVNTLDYRLLTNTVSKGVHSHEYEVLDFRNCHHAYVLCVGSRSTRSGRGSAAEPSVRGPAGKPCSRAGCSARA